MSSAAAAEFSEVVKEYPRGWWGRDRIRALGGVTLRIPSGTVFGLLGPNRAGKTTLVKLLLSLCRPTSGEVRRLGRPAADLRTLKGVGYVHENPAFPRYLSARGLLEYYGALSLLPEEDVKKRVPPLLETVGLADRSEEPIARFSKGMVQRLGLAQALLDDPDLLVLDEPSEGLDLPGRQMVRDLIGARKKAGKTVLFVSHVVPEVEAVCDRVAVLRAGKLAFEGDLDDLGRGGGLEAQLLRLYAPGEGNDPLAEKEAS